MRNWKNWLAPIFTCLTVVALALLPLRLSMLQDKTLTGTVHTEPLAEDSNFPAKPPELLRRLQLLAQQREFAETLTIIGQELEGSALTESTELGRRELADLVESGVLPEHLNPDNAELFAGKVYLRDQTDLSGASFVRLDGYDRDSGEYHSLVLDAETELLVELELDSVWILKAPLPDPAALGAAFLDRLGLEYQAVSHDPLLACFRLQGAPVVYYVSISQTTLRIAPWLDWEALELSGSWNEALGSVMDSSISGNRT